MTPSTADILRMAREAGIVTGDGLRFSEGQRYRSLGVPRNVREDHLVRFAALVAAHVHARRPPSIVVNTADLDPALLRDMLAKAPAMPILPMPAEPTPEAIAAAVAAEREACAQACYKAAAGRLYAQDFNACADAIRARGAA